MTEWIVEPAATGLALAALIAFCWGIHQLFSDVRINRRVNQIAPRVRRLSDRELLGDDYRKHVAAYAAKVERRRQIVRRRAGV